MMKKVILIPFSALLWSGSLVHRAVGTCFQSNRQYFIKGGCIFMIADNLRHLMAKDSWSSVYNVLYLSAKIYR